MMLKLTGTHFRFNTEFGGAAVDAEGGLQKIVFNAKIVDSQWDTSLDLPEPDSVLRLLSSSVPPSPTTRIEFDETVNVEKSLGDTSIIVNKEFVHPEVDVMQAEGSAFSNLDTNFYAGPIQLESPGGLSLPSPMLGDALGLEVNSRNAILSTEFMDMELAYPDLEDFFNEGRILLNLLIFEFYFASRALAIEVRDRSINFEF
jgi:hypothetical protein